MKKVRIKVENVSKTYRLGEVGTGTISHDLNRLWAKIRGKEDPFALVGVENDRTIKTDDEFVNALTDISFEVKEGEVLGIIGRNGAGKSTLLKVLSKVTGPTTGEIKINGRIGSLLEVGTGMHPELTGSENIYLNGAILGMTKKQISEKIDEIIEFAGIAKYADTPFKRYSSGMRVRLGFAVAAFLEPEILIVDEVLAVGDAEFQKKAIGKMQNVSQGHGRTILFVSHNMAAVKSLCTRVVLIENGRIVQEGETNAIVSSYLNGAGENKSTYKTFQNNEVKGEDFNLTEIGIYSEGKTAKDPIEGELNMVFEIAYESASEEELHINLKFKGESGDYIFVAASYVERGQKIIKGKNRLLMTIPKNYFLEGTYYLDFQVVKNMKESILNEKDILSFTVVPKISAIGAWMGKGVGYLRPEFQWDLVKG